MTLFDYYLRYMTEVFEGQRPAPEGITLPEDGDEAARIQTLGSQLQAMGMAALGTVPGNAAVEARNRVEAGVSDYLKFDMIQYDSFYRTRKNETATKVGDKVNSTYLQTSGDSSGLASYGEVCDLLVSWHIQEILLPSLAVEENPFDPLDKTQVDLTGIVNAR